MDQPPKYDHIDVEIGKFPGKSSKDPDITKIQVARILLGIGFIMPKLYSQSQ